MLGENKTQAARLIPQIAEIRTRALDLEQTHEPELAIVLTGQRNSACNLLHYLALSKQAEGELTEAKGLIKEGVAERLLETGGSIWLYIYASNRSQHAPAVAEARSPIETAAREEARAGRAMGFKRAVEYALQKED